MVPRRWTRRRATVESITIYPPTRGVQTQGDPFEPVKIGILIDIDTGQLIYDWVNATILAIEDALNEGVYDRPVELITVDARSLPRENYLKARKGYLQLVEQGCVVILGPEVSDNAVQPHGPRRRDEGARHLVDVCGALLRRVLLHRRQRRHRGGGHLWCVLVRP